MGGESKGPSGPDLKRGIPAAKLKDGEMLGGHVDDHDVLLARVGNEFLALSSHCTHYGGPLAEGLVVGDTVRCPWHHACFSLRTGEAVGAPGLRPVHRWTVERRGELVCVTGQAAAAPPPRRTGSGDPESVVIVGGGAAADAAADMLRRLGYGGPVTMISDDDAPPVDRPNLSKDYLAGDAPEEWIPLRADDFYERHGITLVLGRTATRVDPSARAVRLDDGTTLPYGALLLATGASPVRLPEAVDPGGRVLYLRTLADSRAIVAAAEGRRRALVLGASFIGLEVAAALRKRGLEVHVAAPEPRPLERILGPELGDFVRALHEREGVVFHLGRKVQAVDAKGGGATLDDGSRVDADLVIAGVGVRPREELATQAGLATDKGILVDALLQTSAPGVFAAGDVARYSDPRTGEKVRIEHWVHAQRMGQAAARNILGAREPFTDVPFFWSRHYDASLSYVGHAERWDGLRVDGSLAAGDAAVTYRAGERVLAVVTVGRDRQSLEAEADLERDAGRAAR